VASSPFNVFPLPTLRGAGTVRPHVERTGMTAWQARIATEAPRVPWDVFTRDIFHWKQGEHVGLIGPTGQGKTTLLMHMLPLQPYVVVFATKPHDVTMERLISTGYLRMDRWASISPDRVPRRVLWPDATRLDSEVLQYEVFKDALERIYRERGWCVVIDEGSVMVETLKLHKEIKTYLRQGRSLGISLVFATQRPAFVPLEVYDQSTHLFFYRDNDERNLSRLSGISWRSADLIRYAVANLEQYQALYINTRTGHMYRTRVPGPIVLTAEGR
jgi:hypothetical protein